MLRGWSHGMIPSRRSCTHARRWRPLGGLPIKGALLMLDAFVRSIVALVFIGAVLLFLASAGARSRRPGSTPDLVQMITPTAGATVAAHPPLNVIVMFAAPREGKAGGPPRPGRAPPNPRALHPPPP